MESIDPMLANPSYLIDPENSDPQSLINDVIAASSVKRKRNIPQDEYEIESETGSAASGSGGFTAGIEMTGEPEYLFDSKENAKNIKVSQDEDDWIVGSSDIAKAVKDNIVQDQKTKKKGKKEKHKQSNKRDKELNKKDIQTDPELDWIAGSGDIVAKKTQQPIKADSEFSGSGSASGSGEYQFEVKPYSPEAEKQIIHQKSITNVENLQSERKSVQSVNLTTAVRQNVHNLGNQTLQNLTMSREVDTGPHTLHELVAPLKEANETAKNTSNEVINHLVDKVVQSPNLRNDYLYQLTHQQIPVGR